MTEQRRPEPGKRQGRYLCVAALKFVPQEGDDGEVGDGALKLADQNLTSVTFPPSKTTCMPL